MTGDWRPSLGFRPCFEAAIDHRGTLGRVVGEHRGVFMVRDGSGDWAGELPGRLRRAIQLGEKPRPAIGDWVLHEPRAGGATLLLDTLPRRTLLSRKAAGKETVEQVLAANVERAFVVLPARPEPNPRLLERYLAMVREGGVEPVVLLTKCDLVAEVEALIVALRPTLGEIPVVPLGIGSRNLDAALLPPCETVILLGPSGAGKSTLLNAWLGEERAEVGEVDLEFKGRHTTTRRELFVLPSGALVIDTPGIRELGVWGGDKSRDEVFTDIEALAPSCRFADCRHAGEPGCAVRDGVSPERLAAYRKLEEERRAMATQKEGRARSGKGQPPRGGRT